MSSSNVSHYSAAEALRGRVFEKSDYQLIIVQQPQICKVFVGKEKDRKPIDPPPIVQLKVNHRKDPQQNFLQDPWYFVSCSLLNDDSSRALPEESVVKNSLAGTVVSSVHRLKDTSNKDGGFFVFGDVSVKVEGKYKLQFDLFQIQDDCAVNLCNVVSDTFRIHPQKNFPGMSESTFMTRTFSDQGVRLRLRKEPRFRLQTHGPASNDYQPKSYNTNKRRQSEMSSATSPGDEGMAYLQPAAQGTQFGEPFRHQHGDFTLGSQSNVHLQSSSLTANGFYEGMHQKESESQQSDQSLTSYPGQNYSVSGSPQYGPRQMSATGISQAGNYSQPVPPGYGLGQVQNVGASYGRDQSGGYNTPRRVDNQYSQSSAYDMSGGRQQLTPPSAGYFSGSQQPHFSMPPQSTFGQPISQSLAPGFTTGRVNSLGIPEYAPNMLQRADMSSITGIQGSSPYRQPSLGQIGLPYGAAAQLPTASSGAEYPFANGWNSTRGGMPGN